VKNIALVGFMGTGKTTVARILAKKMKADFVDIDDLIETREGTVIVEIFKTKREDYFRKIEKNIVKDVSSQMNKVIACGGGVVLDKENIFNLKTNGLIVCLEARPGIILKRTQGYPYRPLLNVADPKTRIEELLKKRRRYYARADYTIDTSDLSKEEVADRILQWVKEKG